MKFQTQLSKKQPAHLFRWTLFLLCACFIQKGFAQVLAKKGSRTTLQAVQEKYGLDPAIPLLKRVGKTPDDVLAMFKEAGIPATEHLLTKEELNTVESAIAILPPLHQRVLQQHLKSFSFLDSMPNTALTSPISDDEGENLYHFTFRAGLLHQTVSDWMTQKENTIFAVNDSSIEISIQAGLLNAMAYILLHEGTHVVDGSLHLLAIDSVAGKPRMNSFTRWFAKGIWKDMATYEWHFTDSLVIRNRFRRDGRQFRRTEAIPVYKGLVRTPFASFYSTASWHEDLAELLTLYHLTQKYGQPFHIIVSEHGKEIARFEPINSRLVKRRFRALRSFYR